MVALARAHAGDTVSVVGRRALDIAVDLYRSGFDQVTCGCALGLPCAGEHSGVLFIDGPVENARLRKQLAAACSLLDAQGVLVMRLTDIDQGRLVEAVLGEQGLEILSAIYDLSVEVLVAHRVARRERPAMAA